MTPSDPSLPGDGRSRGTGTPEDWRRALQLLDALLALEPPAREAALAAADAPDPVRERVQRMLDAEHASCLIDEPLVHVDHPPAPSVESGIRLGRWQLLVPVGKGGMSTVWRAQSLEEPIGQLAALKRLDPSVMDAAGLRRFEREMGILATLRHPGVATILDAGRDGDGVPWFAMTLVDGEPIDRWCAGHAPDLRKRVDLLRQACIAVAHAHRHLVVHRDIKPGNVLVDGEGRVVLVDFGISRIVEEGRIDGAGTDATGTYAFTPRFAAPEQRIGGAISTATDLWGLGALAYFVLCGEAPVLADGAEAVVAPATLPTDLRAVLSRCLQRDPTERYRSADALADDLQAFLDGRPVRARGDGLGYRAGRWLRRHPAVASLSAALVLSLLVGVAASLQQARRAEAEATRALAAQDRAEAARREAEAEAQRAEALRRFTVGLFEGAVPGRAPDEIPETHELIEQGIARARDPGGGSAELRADMLLTLAEILSKRLQFEESQALLDEAKALAGGSAHASRDLWARILLYQADHYRRQRQYDRMEDALAEGIAWLSQHHPQSIELLEMKREKAVLALHREAFDDAEAQLLDVIARIDGRSGLGTLPLRLAGDLAIVYARQGRMAEALASQEDVLAMKRADPTTSSVSMANTLFNIGSAHWSSGNLTAARQHFDELLVRLAGVKDPLQVRAATLHAQARVAHALGEVDDALAKIDASAEEWARAIGRAGPEEHFFGPHHRGRILADLGRREEAMATMRESIRRIEASSEAPADRIAATRARMAAMACDDGDVSAGEALLAQATREATPAPPWAQAEGAAHCALARGDAAAAVAHLESVQRRGPERSNDPEFDLMRYEVLYAEALAAAGRGSDARREATAVRHRLDALGAAPDHVLRARTSAALRAAGLTAD